ncbi:MAG TPA: type II toxin-antitoxin system VapC family toxin [Caulobacteraceae bacterium]|nr:type II toxin-antitoxin system VapC family toxin [Caulobacteraceae bacterium]
MSLYLDASIILPLFVNEPNSVTVNQLLSAAQVEFWVSEFAATEVASALSRLVRMGYLTTETAQARLIDLDLWRAGQTNAVEIEASDVHAASAIVRRFDLKLRAPDALHIAICRRLDSTLATLDKRLAFAAKALDVDMAPV